MLTCSNRNFFHCLSSVVSSLLLFKAKIIISDKLELFHKKKKKKKKLKINEHRFYNIEVVVLSMKTHSISSFFFSLMKSPRRDKESEKKKKRHWFFLGLLAE